VVKLLEGRRQSYVFHKRRASRAKKARRRKRRSRDRQKGKPNRKPRRKLNAKRVVVAVESTAASPKRKWSRTPNSRFIEWKLSFAHRIKSSSEERISRRLVDLASYVESLCALACQNRYIMPELKRHCKDVIYAIDFRNFFESKKEWSLGPKGLPNWLKGRFYRAFWTPKGYAKRVRLSCNTASVSRIEGGSMSLSTLNSSDPGASDVQP